MLMSPYECATAHQYGHAAPQWNEYFNILFVDLFISFCYDLFAATCSLTTVGSVVFRLR